MRPVYRGVKYYSPYDLSFTGNFEEATRLLDTINDSFVVTDINCALELHNAIKLVSSPGVKKELAVSYETPKSIVMKAIATFFKAIDDDCLLEHFKGVAIEYLDDFWELFVKFKVYINISPTAFSTLLHDQETTLHRILEHKEIVSYYDSLLSEFMRESDQTARIITGKFLEKKHSNSRAVYIPSSLKPAEFEVILLRYIEWEFANVGVLQLIANSQSCAECPISDLLRLKAKKKAQEYWEKHEKEGINFSYGVGVCFKDVADTKSFKAIGSNEYQFSYDINWLKDNLDYPTILNNYIYLFDYVDHCYRCSFVSVKSKLGIFERTMGVKGKKEYVVGSTFRFMDMKTSAEMQAYTAFLEDLNIRIEDIISWFFKEYLMQEFGVEGFVMNPPSEGSTLVEKNRTLPSELDGVFKQFRMLVTDHIIDRELFEISSNPVSMSELPSMLKNKYAYVNSESLTREQNLLFSDQSMLMYVPKYENEARSFAELLVTHTITISDYPDWEMKDLNWLQERGSIYIDEQKIIRINGRRVALLRDLYDHDVLCCYYYRNKEILEQLIVSGDLRYGNTLFSVPEQEYLNYMLNKSEYSNGMDLRNKYIHSTYPLDEKQQQRDYIHLLKIMMLTVLKINEEYCLGSRTEGEFHENK